ncbi:MAG: SMC family ATPase [Clostridiales bacterium]|nr:SMC family ATPase [Clostridiales bacterium]
MKPVYLEFCGVNSFSEKAVVDFRKLFVSGVFGIFGDTGSGKSTILDCIQLALYGTIDRSSETECINNKSDGFYIVYDFELVSDGVRKTYRARRERTRKSGNNTKAFLWELSINNEWLAIAEGTRDVNAKLAELIGLSLADFKLCIALPQGEFAGLVKAKPADRLALVSRLFDLGKYGERLKFYLKEKCAELASALTITETKLNALDDCSEEKENEAKNRLTLAKENLQKAEERYCALESEIKTQEGLLLEKTTFEKALVSYKKMQSELPIYEEKRQSLASYPLLKTIIEKTTAFEDATFAKEKTEKELTKAIELEGLAKIEFEKAQEIFDEGNFDEQINEASRILGRFESAKEDVENFKNAERKLQEIRNEYRALSKAIENEEFDENIKKLTLDLERLGNDDTLADYVRNHLKDALVMETYGEVRCDLRALSEKYPETQEDVLALLKKYTLVEMGSAKSFDISKAQMDFKLLELKRKQIKDELLGLETRKKAYEENESKKRLIVEEGKLLSVAYERAKEKLVLIEKDGTQEEVFKRLNILKENKRLAENRLKESREKFALATTSIETAKVLKENALKEWQALSLVTEKVLKENGFNSALDVKTALAKIGDENLLRETCDKFFAQYVALSKQISEAKPSRFEKASEETVYALKSEKRELDDAKKGFSSEIGKAELELKKLEETREKYLELEKEYKEQKKKSELWERLRACVSGRRSDKTLMDFIATEYLQDICKDAGVRLATLTNGKYFLEYTNGEFYVKDNLNNGEYRSVRTLSGGETFLVSLSLALALSSAICQKSMRPAEFFFLDEGFGTLDGKLVETVMDVLGKLSKTFTVGLISHVEELKQRIESKLIVNGATETRGSVIRMESF